MPQCLTIWQGSSLSKVHITLHLSSDGWLRSWALNPHDKPLSALEAFDLYGGEVIEHYLGRRAERDRFVGQADTVGATGRHGVRPAGSDPSTTSASAAMAPSGPTNSGLMSASLRRGARAAAICEAATRARARASLSAGGWPR